MPVGRSLAVRGRRPLPVSGATGGAVAPVGWTPAQLSPTGWWDAQDSGTLTTSGGVVSAWANKGSQGGSLGNATTSARPTLAANRVNTYSAVSSNGSQFLEGSLTQTTSFFLQAIVGVVDSANAQFSRLVADVKSGGFDNNTADHCCVYTDGTNVVPYRNASLGSNSISFGTAFMLIVAFDGTNVVIRLNGAQTNSTASSGAFNATLIRLLAGYENGNNRIATGAIGEAVFDNKSSSTATVAIQKLEGSFRKKWGIALPNGHPYQTTDPT